MEVIPAVDIMGGRCVQLVGGKPETRKDYGSAPDMALRWKKQGASILHLVDLDSTLGLGDNLETALKVKETVGIPVEFGGGIRDLKTANKLLDAFGNEDRIIIGTLAVNDYPNFEIIKKLRQHKDRIIVSVDSRGGYVTVKGWTQKSRLSAQELMSACCDYVWGFLYTNVDVEGRMDGIDALNIEEVVRATTKPVIVSGGITSMEDIKACRMVGAWGVVLGKALYEGKIALGEVI